MIVSFFAEMISEGCCDELPAEQLRRGNPLIWTKSAY